MSLIKKILERRSIRRYKQDPIPDNVMKNILEAGRLAPSASNRQPWHFIVVTDKTLKKQLSQGRWNRFIADSAATIVGCGDPELAPKWYPIDVTIALQNMVIAAQAQGVGSCWIGDFVEEEVKKLLNIPEKYRIVALLSLGYPAEEPEPRNKKAFEEIVHYDKF
jgi:nitroreductase